MDGAGLSLQVISTFKELYLLSKFIVKKVQAAKNWKSEKQDLEDDFRTEVIFLRCIFRVFLQNNGVVDDEQLNDALLHQILRHFNRLRLLCGDYAKIAAEQDSEYRAFSPYMIQSNASNRNIDFSLAIEDVDAATCTKPNSSAAFSLKWLKAAKPLTEAQSWKWALWDKRKFEMILHKFKTTNAKLKEMLPLMLACHPRYSNVQNLQRLTNNEDASRLGIASHARLRQLALSPVADTTKYALGHCSLESLPDKATLNFATLKEPGSRDQKVLVEYKNYDGSLPTEALENLDGQVQQLASRLSSSGSHNLTLPFQGFIKEEALQRYAFVFTYPTRVRHTPPESLNSLIKAARTDSRFSLITRFRVAETVAKVLGNFHADGWVHKSVRSHSIMFFEGLASQPYDSPYLVDFEFSRPEMAETQYTYDNDVEKNLYRHPERTGQPTVTFNKLHDIYALGVVLLEIGLWQSALSIYDNACENLREGVTMSRNGIKNMFFEVAKRRLPHHMGEPYVAAVITCLSSELQDVAADQDFYMKFQENVVQKINVKSWSERQ